MGLTFLSVGAAELKTKWYGESAQRVQQAFEEASRRLPCLLFFDEFDAIAGDREDNQGQEDRSVVDQLLRSLEAFRGVDGLIVMAATNDIDHLDPAVIRPGRFDLHIRVNYPDQESRKAILATRLGKLACGDIDLDLVARRCKGRSAAAITGIIQSAALDAFRGRVEGDGQAVITTAGLIDAITRLGGKDRPAVAEWNWNDLVLDPNTKAELQEIQAFIEHPSLAGAFGIDAPAGLLLYGPPGTGKTTIAKVLAAETHASFYPVTGADILSKWVGESERNIARLFARARENRPSVIFIDEIDALFPRRGLATNDGYQAGVVDQFLGEMDGMGGQDGVFIIGATNRRDILDPALLRGGRLSRQIEIPLPDRSARLELFRLNTARMPLRGVDLDALADGTEGLSGADVKALCQEAAMLAAMRVARSGATERTILDGDFRQALAITAQQRKRHV